jgi:hypothetical protein
MEAVNSMTRLDDLVRLRDAVKSKGNAMMLGDFLDCDFGDLDETACALNALNAHSPKMCVMLIDALIAQGDAAPMTPVINRGMHE